MTRPARNAAYVGVVVEHEVGPEVDDLGETCGAQANVHADFQVLASTLVAHHNGAVVAHGVDEQVLRPVARVFGPQTQRLSHHKSRLSDKLVKLWSAYKSRTHLFFDLERFTVHLEELRAGWHVALELIRVVALTTELETKISPARNRGDLQHTSELSRVYLVSQNLVGLVHDPVGRVDRPVETVFLDNVVVRQTQRLNGHRTRVERHWQHRGLQQRILPLLWCPSF